MNVIDRYFSEISRILDDVMTSQREALERAAEAIADATMAHRNVFTFGCSHAGLLSLELFYRTGGLATVNPIRAPGMMLEISPITMTSEMERLPGYGEMILRNTPLAAGDVLLIHSVSGRNAVAIEMAQAARSIGAKVIVLTNLQTSRAVSSRHASGKKLYDFGDIVLDNCGCVGDSSLQLPGLPVKTAPTSTAIGAVLVNAIAARAIERMLEAGFEPPVFLSANLDGGDEHNRRMMDAFHDNIFYMG